MNVEVKFCENSKQKNLRGGLGRGRGVGGGGGGGGGGGRWGVRSGVGVGKVARFGVGG